MFPCGKGGVAAVDSGNYGNASTSGSAPGSICGVDRRHSFSYGFIPVGQRAGTTRCGCSHRRCAGSVGNAHLHSPDLDELTRSMTDCHSLADTKVTTNPVLYLPAELAAPQAVKSVAASCGVKVAALPRRIAKLGDLMPEELTANGLQPGLLYLPNKYVVPGGRFNEMYGWDSYFIVLGLIADHREELARGMVDNFFFEIEHYGAVLNANRTYYLTRSQPPFLTSMIRAVYEDPASFTSRADARTWLEEGYERATRTMPPGCAPSTRRGTPVWPAITTTARAQCRRWRMTQPTIRM